MSIFTKDEAQAQKLGAAAELSEFQNVIYQRMMVSITPYEADPLTGEFPDIEHEAFNKSFYIAWDRKLNAACNSRDGANKFYNIVNDRLLEMRQDDPQMVDDKTFKQMLYVNRQRGIYISLKEDYDDLDAAYNAASGGFFDKDKFDNQWTNNDNKRPTAKQVKLRNDLIAQYQAEETERVKQAIKDGEVFGQVESLNDTVDDLAAD